MSCSPRVIEKEGKKFICRYCQSIFKHQSNLSRHQNHRCLKRFEKNNTEHNNVINISQLKNELKYELRAEFEKEIAELKKKPTINNQVLQVNNQVLQVICVSNNDNYLDMLTEQCGNFDQALEYIKDCALSNLTGDCKLIKKIYFANTYTGSEVQPSIRFLDKNRTKVEYFNEKKEKIIDSKELFARKIANNLQNSYLKGVNHLIKENLENHRCPNKFLEDYDLQTWNQHIYDLSDMWYQKKIINNLDTLS